MTFYFPKNKLLKHSIRLSFAISLMMVFFFWASGKFENTIIFRFIGAFIFFLLTSWFNIFLFKQANNLQVTISRKLFFLLKSYIGSLLSWLISWIISSPLAILFLHSYELQKITKFPIVALSVLCADIVVVLIQRLVISQYNESRKEVENISLKANLADASNLLLIQQLQPHFLFNALSTMKSLYKQNQQQGEEYLVHLASFLRESVANRAAQTVLVKEELDFCTHYMNMQEIRFGSAVDYSVQVPDNISNYKYLPYFSLQPLIENAFKHNDFTEEIPIKIEIVATEFDIIVCNTLREKAYPAESIGHGLHNLSERYKLLGEQPIVIHSENDFFEVRLKLLDK